MAVAWRKDAPSYFLLRDGCIDWPRCLSCPFPQCRYDVSSERFQLWLRIFRTFREIGLR